MIVESTEEEVVLNKTSLPPIEEERPGGKAEILEGDNDSPDVNVGVGDVIRSEWQNHTYTDVVVAHKEHSFIVWEVERELYKTVQKHHITDEVAQGEVQIFNDPTVEVPTSIEGMAISEAFDTIEAWIKDEYSRYISVYMGQKNLKMTDGSGGHYINMTLGVDCIVLKGKRRGGKRIETTAGVTKDELMDVLSMTF